MRLIIHDAIVKVENAPLTVRQELRDLLAAYAPGYAFHPKFRTKQWDGKISLFNKSTFPTGLLPNVIAKFDRIELDDRRNYPAINEDWWIEVDGFDYRDYQPEAVEAILNVKTGTLKMATNAGKTFVMACLIKAVRCKAVVIVPTVALLEQTSADLHKLLGVDIGKFGGGSKAVKGVTVTTLKSLPMVIKAGVSKDNAMVVVDECHHAKASTIFDNIHKVPGPYRVGMSGTPLTYSRLNDLKLVGATGPVIYEVTNQDLIQGGYSSNIEIIFHLIDDPFYQGSYADAYKECIVRNQVRNELIADICLKREQFGPVLVIVEHIEHLKQLAALIDNSIMVKGGDDTVAAIKEFDGSNRTLIATRVLGEGVNIPTITTLVMAAGQKSHIQLLQRIGRGLRKAEGKSKLTVYDFLDDTSKFLFKHSEERYNVYKQEGFKIKLA